MSEAVDATESHGFDVVTQEESVVTPWPATRLLQQHQQHGLCGVSVTLGTVPVVPLQLRQDTNVSHTQKSSQCKYVFNTQVGVVYRSEIQF